MNIQIDTASNINPKHRAIALALLNTDLSIKSIMDKIGSSASTVYMVINNLNPQ